MNIPNPSISDATYGLIGHPLGHSFSKVFFEQLFAQERSGDSYANFDLPELTDVSLYLAIMSSPKLRGFNVTAPYKRAIMAHLDGIDDTAIEVGAVNTVAIRRFESGAVAGLVGYNTDVVGFRNSIAPLISEVAPDKGALILGTGGASDAAAYVFKHMDRPFLKVSRAKRAEGEIIGYEDITAELLEKFPIIVNCTPLGTFPEVDACPPFPYELLTPSTIAYDMVYNPDPSLFLRKAHAQGAKIKSGIEMLVLQALESLKIWRTHSQD